MVELTGEQIRAANERGRIVRETQPHALSARYDAKAGQVVVELANGATFAFPPRLVEGLHDASPADVAAVEVIGGGFGLHWEALDLDYSVPGLVNGLFGTARWMAARAGRAISPAKAAAARANGQKGGRPRVVAKPTRPTSGEASARKLVTAEDIARHYGLNPRSYRAALRSAGLGWHEKNKPWKAAPASPEQRDMLEVAEGLRARS